MKQLGTTWTALVHEVLRTHIVIFTFIQIKYNKSRYTCLGRHIYNYVNVAIFIPYMELNTTLTRSLTTV